MKYFLLCLFFSLVISGCLFSPDDPDYTDITAEFSGQNLVLAGKISAPDGESSGILVSLAKPAAGAALAPSYDTIAVTVTDNNGIYTFSDVQAGTYYVTASKGSLSASQSVTLSPERAITTLDNINITPTGALKGKVSVNTDYKSGIIVFIKGTSYTAVTDNSGEFGMTGIPVGSYYLMAMLGGSAFSSQQVTVAAGTAPVDAGTISIQYSGVYNPQNLYDNKIVITGKVYISSTTTAIPNARIYIKELNKVALSDSAGAYSVYDVPVASSYTFNISADNYSDAAFSLSVAGKTAGDIVTQNISLSSSLTSGGISGKVTQSGSPLARAIVTLQNSNFFDLSDSAGKYSFSGVSPGTYIVCAYKTGFGVGTVSVSLSALESKSQDVAISGNTDYASVSGTVTSGGSPVENVVVAIVDLNLFSLTNSSGQYAVNNVPAGNYTVKAIKEGFVASSAAVAVTSANYGGTVSQNFALTADSASIIGTVIDGATPLENVIISIADKNYNTLTSATGQYTIPGLPVGSYTVKAVKQGYSVSSAAVTVASGNLGSTVTQNFTITADTASIAGTVTDGATPLENVIISIADKNYNTLTSATGQYTIPGLPVGSYTVKAVKQGYATSSAAVTVASGNLGGTVTQNYALTAQMGILTGTVSDENSKGVSDCIVSLKNTQYTAFTDMTGKYTFPSLPYYTYEVIQYKGGYDGSIETAIVNAATVTLPLKVTSGIVTSVAITDAGDAALNEGDQPKFTLKLSRPVKDFNLSVEVTGYSAFISRELTVKKVLYIRNGAASNLGGAALANPGDFVNVGGTFRTYTFTPSVAYTAYGVDVPPNLPVLFNLDNTFDYKGEFVFTFILSNVDGSILSVQTRQISVVP